MRIRRLDIQGFKSFVDRTTFLFDSQITAVVGPNGCGKSNLVDAIRWVMGEQSTRNLRGRSMEDIIFSGSESRQPTGLAEVTLTFDNSDGLAPPEYASYAEIAVSRRLFRGEPENEYLINKVPVRHKDVVDLFLGTGVGTKAYSIVEQGKIGSIVNAKPEERRYILEEAAGITKYRAHKRVAERKMDSTRQNLLRVSDVLSEIEKNLASLKRQAEKAERYKRYRAEIRDLDLYVASHRFLELRAQGVGLDRRMEAKRAEQADAEAALSAVEAEVETLRLRLVGEESEAEKLQGRSYELDNSVRLLESELAHRQDELRALQAREQEAEAEVGRLGTQAGTLGAEHADLVSALEAQEEELAAAAEGLARAEEALAAARAAQATEETRIATANRDGSQAAARVASAEAALRSLERQVRESEESLERSRAERGQLELEDVALDAETTTLTARVEELERIRSMLLTRRTEGEERIATLRAELAATESAYEAVRSELGTKRSRYESLVEIRARRESLAAGPRAAMERVGADGRAGSILADALDVPAELELAVAAVLGHRVEGVLVDRMADALAMTQYLADGDLGRATALPAGVRPAPVDRGAPPIDAAILGPLRPEVRATEQAAPLADALLADVFLVGSLADAIRLFEAGGLRHTLVTLAGELLEPTGAVTGGGRDAAAGLLAMNREIAVLDSEVAKLDERYRDLAARQATLRAAVAESVAVLDEISTSEHKGDIDRVEREQDNRRLGDRRAQIAERLAVVTAEACDIAGRLAEAAHEREGAEDERRLALATQEEAAEIVAWAEQALAACKVETDAAVEALTNLKVTAAQAREKAEGVKSAIGRVEASLEDVRGRIERLRGEVARGAARQGELAARVLLGREERSALVVEAQAAREAVAFARDTCEQTRMAVGEREAGIRLAREAVDAAKEEIREIELHLREVALKHEHLATQVLERHRIELQSAVGDYHMRAAPDPSVPERIVDLQRLVERMGEINLTAIEEYEEQSKRHEFLSAQKKDLESALEQLEGAIQKMNRESRRRFREAFDAVNERFQTLFPKLFRGGRARLELVGEEDLLEAGVEIFAQPPGKRLGSIELMSGGEKALTAVSLIFAIFQWKPSPFCLLDEVDAPLDEANVDRFGELVRSLTDRSQFILITHSKRTMALADALYGVTMQEPGVSNTVSVRMREAVSASASEAAAA